ncbi:MAG: CRISPR-associated protein Cse2 [Sphingobacteriia bacterium]|nr:CRISPR-associated protein Cse2 [Sphingobacteriia bacterium]NCC39079.1 CRISPR-associated protein Cse2 [Gammaproteobacteria bacterium]
MSTDTPDFADLYRRFERLPPGSKSPMRRVAKPEDLYLTPGLYRLFPGSRPNSQQIRTAFILPWCQQMTGGQSLGALCAQKISEARVIQIARSETGEDEDLVAFRRLIIQLQPALGWQETAPWVWFWGRNKKRRLVEDYYMSLHHLDQGAKK